MRVVVVGAGVGGLCAAARLAKRGHHVTLVERTGRAGGSLGSYSREGFTFDTGPTAITLPAVFRDTFRKSGRPLERELDLVPVDPAVHHRFADGTGVQVHPARSRTLRSLDGALGEVAARQWSELLDRAERMWQILRGAALESPATERDVRHLLTHPRQLGALAPGLSLRGLARRQLADPRLRQLLEDYAMHQGSDPRRAPAMLAVLPYVQQTFGVWHVPGGTHRLAEALVRRLAERRVDVRTGCEVTRILVDEGRAAGVRLDGGERLEADAVVSGVDARHLYRDLVDGPQARAARRRLGRGTPSASGFLLMLALRGRTEGLAHHTVLYPRAYPGGSDAGLDAGLDAVFGTRGRPARPAPDPVVTICCPDDPAMRPSAHTEGWRVSVPAAPHGTGADPATVDWTARGVADSYAEHVLDVLARRGYDVRPRLLWRHVRTPADVERDSGSPGGSLHGTAWHRPTLRRPRAGFVRPDNRSPLPGLFLVGGSTRPGGGLPLAGLSAALASELVDPA